MSAELRRQRRRLFLRAAQRERPPDAPVRLTPRVRGFAAERGARAAAGAGRSARTLELPASYDSQLDYERPGDSSR